MISHLALLAALPLVSGHVMIAVESMWGATVTQTTMGYDNRAVVPLYNMPFNQWWWHNHKAYPPPPNTFTDLPAGGSVTVQLSCDIGFTNIWKYGPGGDNRQNGSDSACPGQASTVIHANNFDDVTGSAIAIAYKSDADAVNPDDFVIISTNRHSPWFLNNDFQIPEGLQTCPQGGCICAWFWIHAPDSGSEQMYMNAFRCTVSGKTGTKPLGKPSVPRYCPNTPSNCTNGPMNPMYWYQLEGNNMPEGTYDAPVYNEKYGFVDGAQLNLFQDATVGGAPAPATSPSTGSGSGSSQPQPQPQPQPASSSSSPSAAQTSPVQAAAPPPATKPSSSASSSSAHTSPVQAAAPSPPATEPSSSASSSSAHTSPTQAVAPPPPADTPSPPHTPSSSPSAASGVAFNPPTPIASESSATPTPTSGGKKCKRRANKDKRRRSAIKRHLHQRMGHDRSL